MTSISSIISLTAASPSTSTLNNGANASSSASFEAFLAFASTGTSSDGLGGSGSASEGDPLDQIFSELEQMLDPGSDGDASNTDGIAAALGDGGDASNINAYAQQLMAEGGPLPTFLNEEGAAMHLNATQQQAFENIAAENMNSPDDAQTVQTIAGELAQANIPEQIG